MSLILTTMMMIQKTSKVACYSLLVTRVSPFAEISYNKPPRHAYHPRKLHFRGARYCGTPPLEGWRLAAGVVREYGIIHLVPQFVIPAQAGIGLGLLLVILFWE